MMLMMDKLMSHQIINLEDTDSDKELEKEQQERSELGKPRSKNRRQEPNLEPKQSLIGKQNMPGFMNKEEKCSVELA